ncbi:MAG: 5'/3'-nucleotidase SurE [Bacteroidota bacterium]
MRKPLILVTNDDGVTAPGIHALAEMASELGKVVIVAPDSHQSGQGHAVTLDRPIFLRPSKAFTQFEAYECSGTPVDSVKLGKQVVCKDREIALCVSGINHGSNAAINILYSGTMSAAMEASLEGIPSIGFSLLDWRYQADFQAAKPFILQIMQQVLDKGMQHGSLISVNIPQLPREELKGIKVCRQAEARWVEEFAVGHNPRGQEYYWMAGQFVNNDPGEDTDVVALENGYISVVPSMHDMTNYPALKDEHLLALEKNKF